MPSKELAEGLATMEGRPWAEYGRAHKAISPNQVANLLRGYHISPRTIRFGQETAKGYELEQFVEAFSRYLEGEGVPKGNNVTNAVSYSAAITSDKTANVTPKTASRLENDVSHCNDNVCDVVTDGSGQSLEEDKLLI
jgi:hypothetical protein